MDQTEGVPDPTRPVEVALARDKLEATVWAGQLERAGMPVSFQRRGGLLRAILFLGRVPIAVQVAPQDHARALELLRTLRFIE